MLQLLGTELRDIFGKLGIVVAQLIQLALVMTANLGLDRIGASHRRFLADQRGSGSKSEARDSPQGLERGRANPPLGNQRVEAVEMPLFLHRHSRHELGGRRIGRKHSELSGVDTRGAIFARLVDSKDRVRIRAPLAGTPGAAHRERLPVRVSQPISTAPDSDRIAFHPAIEMPNRDHCTWSQRISGTFISF